MNEEPLSPERRFRLYSRIAGIFEDAGMHEASKAATRLAGEAAKESPVIQAEFRRFLDILKETADAD